jgi:hypothetical protein
MKCWTCSKGRGTHRPPVGSINRGDEAGGCSPKRDLTRLALLGPGANNTGKSEKIRRVNAMSTEVLDNGVFAQAQQRLHNPWNIPKRRFGQKYPHPFSRLPPISFMQSTHRSRVKASNAEQDSAATVTRAWTKKVGYMRLGAPPLRCRRGWMGLLFNR